MSEIAHEWMEWLAENALRGVDRSTLVETLTAQGLETPRAAELVDEVMKSPILSAARRVMGRSAGIEQATRLRRAFEKHHPIETGILGEDAFFHHAWSAHRPVVFRGVAADWPAWSLDDFRARFADIDVEVLEGRESVERWWRHREALTTQMSLGQLLDKMNGPVSNNLYGVARNNVFEALPELEDDVGVLPGIRPDRPHRRLWIGPAGTLTPLHHDQSAAWLVQRIGTKRVWLASPLEPALLDTTDGVFNDFDPRVPGSGDASEIHWWETTIEPGDAIFLPAGWWHMVLAESASVSVSVGGFRWANAFRWYAPGRQK